MANEGQRRVLKWGGRAYSYHARSPGMNTMAVHGGHPLTSAKGSLYYNVEIRSRMLS